MNSVNANYRGTACGILDFITNLAALFNTSLIVWLNLNKGTTLFVITVSLFVALFLQTKAGNKRSIFSPTLTYSTRKKVKL